MSDGTDKGKVALLSQDKGMHNRIGSDLDIQ
jgi:hypothetical protein